MSRLGSSTSGHPRVELGVRLTAEHLDVVAEVDEGLGQVADVDALATAVGLAPVREECDAKGAVRRHERLSLLCR